MQRLSITLVLFFIESSLCSSAFRGCNVLFPKDSCFAAYVPLKYGLLEDYQNIYELQRAFYPIGKFASDTLINVQYNIRFTDDAFADIDEDSFCEGVDEVIATDIRNGSLELTFLTGWTSSVVFNVMSPYQLTKLQLQISNIIFSLYTIPGSGIYQDNLFVWRSSLEDSLGKPLRLDLKNIMNLTIYINNITCIPDQQLIKSSLLDITAMLQVWASTEGLTPEQIDKDLLGYVTESGIELSGLNVAPLVQFHPFFAVVATLLCFTIGISSIILLGTAVPLLDSKLGQDREQFFLYYFALSLSSFLVCVIFIGADLYQIPQWCSQTYFNHFTGTEVSGCDFIVIIKVVFICVAIILSLVTSILVSRSYKIFSLVSKTQSDRITDRPRVAFIFCTWFVLLAFSFGGWSLVPTLLQILVYPSVVLTLTLVMWAMIFWCTVIFTIPLLLYQNIKRKAKCISYFHYLSPFVAMVVLVFVFILITVSYLDAVLFGSQIGDVIGIIIAAVPSIGLTFLTEFYRDWFLTRTVRDEDMEGEDQDQGIELTDLQRIPSVPGINANPMMNDVNTAHGELTSTDTKLSLRRRSTGLVSNGEPPGYLQKKLKSFHAINI